MKLLILSSLAALSLAGTSSAQDNWRTQAAAALPQSGEMHLQLIFNDEVDGFMRLGWMRDDENGVIQFYDRSMLASQELYESMSGSVDAETLAPIEAFVRLNQNAAIMTVEARAQDGVMVGSRTFMRPHGNQQSAEINTPLTDGMIMRAAVFFATQTMPLDVGDSVEFDWFSSMGGSVGTVSITAFDGGTIETIAGTFDTLRLELRGAAPENDIYVTNNDGFRQVVRIDITGQPMRFEAFPAVEPTTE